MRQITAAAVVLATLTTGCAVEADVEADARPIGNLDIGPDSTPTADLDLDLDIGMGDEDDDRPRIEQAPDFSNMFPQCFVDDVCPERIHAWDKGEYLNPTDRRVIAQINELVDACEQWVDTNPDRYVMAEKRSYPDQELDQWSLAQVCGDEVQALTCVNAGPCPIEDGRTMTDIYFELADDIRSQPRLIDIRYDAYTGAPTQAFVLYDDFLNDWKALEITVPRPR